MKAATIQQIKQQLATAAPAELAALCLRLAKYKKENKELLAYLLFEAHNEHGYVQAVKQEMDEGFAGLNKTSAYFAKKGISKILRITNKHIKFTGSKQAEAELLIYYCKKLKEAKISLHEGGAVFNLFKRQVKKIETAMAALHEDLQHDYKADFQFIVSVVTHARRK